MVAWSRVVDVRIPEELLPADTWVRGWELRAGAAASRVAVLCWKDQNAAHPDFAAIAALAEGQVIRLTEAAAPTVVRSRTRCRAVRAGSRRRGS